MIQTADQPDVQTDPDADKAEQEFLLQEVESEVNAMEVGDLAPTPEAAALFRYVRRRAQVESEIGRMREQMLLLIRDQERRLEALDYLFRRDAEQAARSMLRGKARSVKTPFGTVGFRKRPARLEVADEGRLLAAAEADIDLIGVVRERREVNRTALAEHFKTTGELPPGCELTPETESFYVK